MALTKLWYVATNPNIPLDGSWLSANTANYNIAVITGYNSDGFTASHWRIKIGSYIATFAAPQTFYSYARLSATFTTTSSIAAGTVVEFQAMSGSSPLGQPMTAALPDTLAAGTHTVRFLTANGVVDEDDEFYYYQTFVVWGAGRSDSDGDVVFDLGAGAPPPSGAPIHLYRTQIISPSVLGSY